VAVVEAVHEVVVEQEGILKIQAILFLLELLQLP
jgi:hypothetical protein